MSTQSSFLPRFFNGTALTALVILWLVPTLGLFVSSIRDKDQLAASGWWTSFNESKQVTFARTDLPETQQQIDGQFVLSGQLTADDGTAFTNILAFGSSSRDPEEVPAGETATLKNGAQLTVNSDGSYTYVQDKEITGSRGKRIFFAYGQPPRFTLENYDNVLDKGKIGQAFLNTLAVTIPATVIPVLIAAFAAYAFSWMQFAGREWLFAVVIGLLVVPLQTSLVPLLRLYSDLGQMFGFESKGYPGVWMAHTGFGLPLAIYLMRNYMKSLPGDLIESARVDGASHFQVFTRIILPLSLPALASFTIFQFLWVWNDLLVALVFLGQGEDQIVLTAQLRALLGTRGSNWEVLTSGAFISIILPLLVFFALQRFFVRGLVAGSVKG
ncbi:MULTISPECIES: carbohydrate ABC transporter permease [unclassified Marinobacterium]|uniref:carbohydrate ABC transporter permease n=1 Tax=unclassified Marinobacterium TaxID=2644139 RepID=UPI001568E1EE|nr:MULTISPECIES: carbohydrate ABC transporter permease [unclassified Marinobacterium]NRP15763.1 L-arabinose transport system permease protein AraQ [Marinobacterium sp. xm-a-152]NRP36058.1 L-arabinose transport system permease protein AraQ [Marinobacterium sp. xm-d-579]NRP38840.1 L-arabinose transport system permease protein AraQ [Marinobacterium sp. xm-a-121]NRP57833.1 L-arabinose transport system permease protein AraQ [Marinobacterium sp. xm-d-510]NRP58978.1 L-arabinose transport system perme